jgi:hypothetical protein
MMHNEVRLHYTPRTGKLESDLPDILIPALAGLRKCTTAFDAVLFIETLPDLLLPALAWEASRKPFIPRIAVNTLVKWCGKEFLERTIGYRKSGQLLHRYPLKDTQMLGAS